MRDLAHGIDRTRDKQRFASQNQSLGQHGGPALAWRLAGLRSLRAPSQLLVRASSRSKRALPMTIESSSLESMLGRCPPETTPASRFGHHVRAGAAEDLSIRLTVEWPEKQPLAFNDLFK
jgi:hypothetical protein